MSHYFSRSFFAEPPVSACVGSDRKIYYIHRHALLSYPSSALYARVTGPWQECGNGEIDWTDFDEQTISCVLQFLYTQDYHASQAVEISGKQSQEHTEKEHVEIEENNREPSGTLAPIRGENVTEGSTSPEPRSPEEKMTEILIDRPLTPMNHCVEMTLPAEHGHKTGESLSQTTYECAPSELLVHAKIYSFAHRYLLDDLADLVLQRLEQTLIIIAKKQLGFCPQLADSISLIYNSTFASNIRENPARNMLSQFVALNYTTMYGSRLQKLLAEGGQFTIDLSWKLARRLMRNPLEEKISELSSAYESLQAEIADNDREIKRLTRELTDWNKWNASRPLKKRRSMPSQNNSTPTFGTPASSAA